MSCPAHAGTRRWTSSRCAIGAPPAWRSAGAACRCQQTVRVYPDIGEAQRQALALIRARQIVMEKRRANVHGLGRDFHSLREFQQGDELRDVCWTATARRGRLVARTYQPERSQTVWIVVDAGRLMRARDGPAHRPGSRGERRLRAGAGRLRRRGTASALLAYGRGTQQRVLPGRGGSASARPARSAGGHARRARGSGSRAGRRDGDVGAEAARARSCGSPTSRRAPPCRR